MSSYLDEESGWIDEPIYAIMRYPIWLSDGGRERQIVKGLTLKEAHGWLQQCASPQDYHIVELRR